MSQIRHTKPLRFVSPTDTTHDHDSQYQVYDSEQHLRVSERAAQTFKKILTQYEREGHRTQYRALFEVIGELDQV